MKKIFYFLSLLFILTSCTEDIKFNNPAFQGLKDNVFWRAQSYSAATDASGALKIEGSLGTDVVILKVSSTTPKTYVLGIDDITVASYSNLFSVDEPEFTTGTNKGSGQIVITDFDAENNTISGTFKFTAPNVNEEDLEKPSLNFKEGVFYKIPITSNLEY